MLAAEQAEQFGAELMEMAARAREIAEGGEAYPVGVRELASRIADRPADQGQGADHHPAPRRPRVLRRPRAASRVTKR